MLALASASSQQAGPSPRRPSSRRRRVRIARTRVHGTCARMTARSSVGEQRRVPVVGQHREERLLVRELAAERVGDADGARLVGLDQRRALVGPRDDVVDQDAAVDEIDPAAVRPSARRRRTTRSRGSHTTVGTPSADERVAQDLELGPGRHLPPVDDRHGRRRRPSRPIRGSSPGARPAAASIVGLNRTRRPSRNRAMTGSASNSSQSRCV